MSRVVSVRGALPAHRYTQAEITETFADVCLPEGARRQLLQRLHTSARVVHRNLALPLERYRTLDGFGAANDAFIDVATGLGAEVVLGALADAGLRPSDVDVVVSTTVTGIAVPSLEARIAGLIGLRPDVRRIPLFGLGCLGGAAGVARLHDHLRGWPEHVGVLLSVELCSLTLQRGDPSTANMVAAGLFGDGAAAVVMTGDDVERPDELSTGRGPGVVATTSVLYPDTQRAMGFDVGESGLKIVLGAEVPALVEDHLRADVESFLKGNGLELSDITTWVCHPGGPKVLEALGSALDLRPEALELTWASLAEIGNLSSASVLHVLRDTIETRPPALGCYGVLMAMGPGFAAELVLLRW